MVPQAVQKAGFVIRAQQKGKDEGSLLRPTGTLLFINAERAEHLHSFALLLASELSQPTPLPVYRVQGGLSEGRAASGLGKENRDRIVRA